MTRREQRKIASPSPALAELLRRHRGLLAEEAGEVGGIGEAEVVGDLVDRLHGEDELALGFREHALADEAGEPAQQNARSDERGRALPVGSAGRLAQGAVTRSYQASMWAAIPSSTTGP